MNTSAESRVIASFTFIVALMLGAWNGLVGLGVEFLPEPMSGVGRSAVGLLPFAATFVAYRATNAAQEAWARTLGSAAVMLGALTCVAGVLFISATL